MVSQTYSCFFVAMLIARQASRNVRDLTAPFSTKSSSIEDIAVQPFALTDDQMAVFNCIMAATYETRLGSVQNWSAARTGPEAKWRKRRGKMESNDTTYWTTFPGLYSMPKGPRQEAHQDTSCYGLSPVQGGQC